MRTLLGLVAQFGLVLGQVNPDNFNEIAQVIEISGYTDVVDDCSRLSAT